MNVIVTGANGMLAQDLIPIVTKGNNVYPITKDDLDIRELSKIEEKLNDIDVDVIINCAAYTKVDLAETERDLAFEINEKAVKNLVDYCKVRNITLTHVSTDYVFDGTVESPYVETDKTNPLSVYGESKLMGETYIQENLEKYFIIRTSWLYGNTGKNFVKTMIWLGETKETFNVVNDQIGCPTYTEDLSHAIFNLINAEAYGLYHFSGEGQCSWFDFASLIIEEAKKVNDKIIVKEINPIPSSEYPTAAKRPMYSVMSKDKYKKNTGKDVPNWKESLKNYFSKNQ